MDGPTLTEDLTPLGGPQLSFSSEEMQVLEHIHAARRGIQAMGLRANPHELDHGTHILQMFVVKHALQRIGFKGLSRWFWSDNETRPPT